MLGNIRQTVVEMCLKRCHTVHMIVSAGENGGPAWCADRVGHITVIQLHSFICYTVDVGGAVNGHSIGADSFRGIVIGHYEQNIGSIGLHPLVARVLPWTDTTRII